MNFRICSILSIGLSLFSSQQIFAGSLAESWEGDTKLNANIYVFAADTSGSIQKGNIKYDVDQPFKESVKELDSSFMAHLDLSKGKWGIYVDKQIVKTSQDKQILSVPLALSTKLDQSSYGIYYQAYLSPETAAGKYSKLIVEPTIGVHHTDVKAELGVANSSMQTSASWNEVFWGARFKYNFDSPWNLASELTFGADNTHSAQAYIGYRVPVFEHNINVRAGYRYFSQDYKSGDFHWDIQQRGPVIGINLPIF